MDEAEVKVSGTGKSRHLLIMVFLVLIVGGLLIALSMKGKDSSFQLVGQSRVKVGSPAPNFTFPDLTGKMLACPITEAVWFSSIYGPPGVLLAWMRCPLWRNSIINSRAISLKFWPSV